MTGSGIPVSRPWFGEEEERAVVEVLRSGWVTQGPVVARFEESVARAVDAQHAVALTSATTGLQAALLALGIGPGDEVVCPSYTFIATPNSIVNVGARPVFADVDPVTWSLDPSAVEAAITPRTAALVPVHMGYPADQAALDAVARRHGLVVLEDAAPALGSRHGVSWGGRAVGSGPGPAVFSFHPRKIVTTGEGGVVTTDDSALADRLRRLRHHHMSVTDAERHAVGGLVFESYDDVGHNWRMTDLQAAVGVAQMAKLEDVVSAREAIARRYDAAFLSSEHLRRRRLLTGSTDTHQTYSLEVLPSSCRDRNAVMRHLDGRGVSSRRGIMSSHLEPAYAKRSVDVHLPVSERLSANSLVLPLFPGMTDAEVDRVVEVVLEAVDQPWA